MKTTQLLFSPFHRIAGGGALVSGMVGIGLAGLIGSAQGLHFDGVLDVHVGKKAPGWVFVVEGFISWLSLALLLLVAGRLLSRTAFRSIDLLGTQALARWPMVLTALACSAPGFHRYSHAVMQSLVGLKPGQVPSMPAFGADGIVFGLVTLLILACTGWMVLLMWKSFSHCCNVRGGKAVGLFIITLLLAEALSKLLIGRLFLLLETVAS